MFSVVGLFCVARRYGEVGEPDYEQSSGRR